MEESNICETRPIPRVSIGKNPGGYKMKGLCPDRDEIFSKIPAMKPSKMLIQSAFGPGLKIAFCDRL
jgi:hypothetical protein